MFEKFKPNENLFKTNPSLYLAKTWAIRFKELIIDPESDVIRKGKIDVAYTNRDLQEKRYLADKVLIFSIKSKMVDNIDEIEKMRWIEKRKRMREFGGKLTTEQRWAFSYDYFELIDKLCDKLLII
jgi:hypothetical protein